ncbi:hypothetical protein D3C84_967110 [compost metagenome]
MVAHDFLAQEFVQVVLQRRQVVGQFFQEVERQRADFAVFQGNGITGVMIGTDSVQAKHFALHLETGDLFATVYRKDAGLEETQSHGIQRAQWVAGAIQRCAFLDLHSLGDQRVEALDFTARQANGQAQLKHAAVRARSLEGVHV